MFQARRSIIGKQKETFYDRLVHRLFKADWPGTKYFCSLREWSMVALANLVCIGSSHLLTTLKFPHQPFFVPSLHADWALAEQRMWTCSGNSTSISCELVWPARIFSSLYLVCPIRFTGSSNPTFGGTLLANNTHSCLYATRPVSPSWKSAS